jgi:IS30 family transposase
VVAADSKPAATLALLQDWWTAWQEAEHNPAQEVVVLAARRAEVDRLNSLCQELLAARGRLGSERLPQGRGQLRDTLHSSQPPAEAADRAVPGHWAGDLVLGRRPSAVGTLVERHRRDVLLFRLPEGVTAHQVRPALTTAVLRLPEQLRRSLTWDHGREMAEHLQFTIDAGVQVYVCDPRSPGQRGSNENTVSVLGGPAGMLGQAGAGNDG